MEQYAACHTQLKDRKNVRFQLSDGRVLHEDLTVAKLAKKAELEKLDGLFLYINDVNDKFDWVIMENFETGDETKIEDECALQEMFAHYQNKDVRSMISINFQLPGTNGRPGYMLTIKRLLKSTFNQFKEELRKQVI